MTHRHPSIFLATALICLLLCSSCAEEQSTLPGASTAPELELLARDLQEIRETLTEVEAQWDESSPAKLIEMLRYLRHPAARDGIFDLLHTHSGKDFGSDLHAWQQWLWNQPATFDDSYLAFKRALYQQLDPRFAAYFTTGRSTTARIRLDEIVWGGVKQDGIPPLRNPKMLTADNADYLEDHHIVFGIAINGDARAYPKRILAWHEMFTDTIGGTPLCGVY
jgi:hypothetical protein